MNRNISKEDFMLIMADVFSAKKIKTPNNAIRTNLPNNSYIIDYDSHAVYWKNHPNHSYYSVLVRYNNYIHIIFDYTDSVDYKAIFVIGNVNNYKWPYNNAVKTKKDSSQSWIPQPIAINHIALEEINRSSWWIWTEEEWLLWDMKYDNLINQ